MSMRKGTVHEDAERRPLLQQGDGTAAGGEGGGAPGSSSSSCCNYGGVSGNHDAPDLAETFPQNTSIFHSMSKSSLVGRPRRGTVDILRQTRRHQCYCK